MEQNTDFDTALPSLGGDWFDPLEAGVRQRIRSFIEQMLEAELEAALTALWPAVPVQRCTVHKHRNLLAHAPKKLHDEVTADYTDMIYAKTATDVTARHK